jgi:hypothetical protein
MCERLHTSLVVQKNARRPKTPQAAPELLALRISCVARTQRAQGGSAAIVCCASTTHSIFHAGLKSRAQIQAPLAACRFPNCNSARLGASFTTSGRRKYSRCHCSRFKVKANLIEPR